MEADGLILNTSIELLLVYLGGLEEVTHQTNRFGLISAVGSISRPSSSQVGLTLKTLKIVHMVMKMEASAK